MKSLSINGRITLDMHSLNNEGSEGNHLQTRMVHIINEHGELEVVNAVSGDMLKHMQTEHLNHILIERKHKALCKGCASLDANRINADDEFFKSIGKEKDVAKVTTALLQYCAMDDTQGVLITKDNRSTPRKSVVEFGWLVGIPEKNHSESHFHVKFDQKREAGSGADDGSNTGQNIFYRPANSGQYAVVLNVELDRIGFNDVTREYVIDEEERRIRTRAVLESILYTFIKPSGAMRNTQNPHILGFEGIISVSNNSIPAPTISPIRSDYKEEIEKVAKELNRIQEGIETFSFQTQSEFTRLMADLIEQL
ncbi:DevR family CRISPR-associated autoregulator [Tepidibacillus fermentans]|uniref:CRISPR-associated Csa2 family autoregulator n=1 Tax=Tepidibacillus fermentans TaxID=1281767 RepID=A0A4R3K817_9BACI|nr:DevR family CRISPR-associated autoregulator [Tepidibacillus fermentans]TCS78923.1 CRISPR-associated Csa2 family autoregulator [Tepidibacillus fermentans]